jgi:hypothetical protein
MVGDDDVWKAKNNTRRAKEARLDVWRGKAGDDNTIIVWKAKLTPDESTRLVRMCGEVKQATMMPDKPKRLVWVCGEVRWMTTTPWLYGKQKEHQTSQTGSSGCVER